MDTSHPHPDETTGRLVADTRTMVAGIITFLMNLLHAAPPGPMPAAQIRTFVRTMIKPCEALLRRAIFLLAAGMLVPAPRKPSPARPGVAPPPSAAPPGLRVPAFRLTEPAGGRTAPATLARPLPRPAAAAPDPGRLAAAFLRRLGALRAACADPDRCAVRLRRRLVKLQISALPLAPSPPSGILRARSGDTRHLYARLTHALSAAWPQRADTS